MSLHNLMVYARKQGLTGLQICMTEILYRCATGRTPTKSALRAIWGFRNINQRRASGPAQEGRG